MARPGAVPGGGRGVRARDPGLQGSAGGWPPRRRDAYVERLTGLGYPRGSGQRSVGSGHPRQRSPERGPPCTFPDHIVALYALHPGRSPGPDARGDEAHAARRDSDLRPARLRVPVRGRPLAHGRPPAPVPHRHTRCRSRSRAWPRRSRTSATAVVAGLGRRSADRRRIAAARRAADAGLRRAAALAPGERAPVDVADRLDTARRGLDALRSRRPADRSA